MIFGIEVRKTLEIRCGMPKSGFTSIHKRVTGSAESFSRNGK